MKAVQDLGGHLTLEDLKNHMELGSEPTEPLYLRYRGQNVGSKTEGGKNSDSQGINVWEHPPNGQGIVALMALGILESLEKTGKIRTFTPADHNSAEYLHAVIEALKLAFGDATWFVTDPSTTPVPTSSLLSPDYLASRATLFNPSKADPSLFPHGSPGHQSSDTVYFAVTDRHGNACSFINSLYGQFGTGIIPPGTGFALQNRGANFSLDPGHPNAYAGGKRPYHTIIPAMVTNPDGTLNSVLGVMGGFMQPQGHVQVLLNMMVFGMDPQKALDAPRFCIGAGTPESGEVLGRVFLEEGIADDVVERLGIGEGGLGHDVVVIRGWDRERFGRGQVIRCHYDGGRVVYSAGSDPRGDGGAFPV